MKKLPPSVQNKISVCLIWAGAFLTFLTNTLGFWCMVLGLVIVVAAIFYRNVMLVCPCCGHKIAGAEDLPDRCPRCGEPIL